MTSSTARLCKWTLASVAFVLATPHDGRAQAQSSSTNKVTTFNISEYYAAPNQTQMKYQMTGAEAQPEGGGKFRIKQMKLQTFRESSEREFVVDAPECVYDSAKRVVSSPGQLQVQIGDGRFSVEGEGFLWQQSESFLTISNQVRSLIQRAAPNSPDTEATPPLVITSRRFEFDMPKREGVYRDQVHGDDPQMEFSCGVLTASTSTNSQSFDLLVAEMDVSLVGKTNGLSANADRAVYTRADERMELTGHFAWKRGRQEGRSDRAVIRRLEESFAAEGNVAMKLPRESFGLGGFFLTATNVPAPAPTNSSPRVDLFADRFHSRPNFTVAEGAVRVIDATNRLTCDKLSVQSATSASPEEMATAEGRVVVTQGNQTNRLRSERAVYTKSDGTIVFTERPEWNLDQSEGRADRVTVHNLTGEFHAEGNVATKVTLGPQQGSFLKFFPDAPDTNQAPQVLEIFASDLKAKDRRVTFLGDACAHQSPITGSEPRLRSDVFDMRFGTNEHNLESIQARDNVVYEQGISGVTNGPNVYRKLTTRTLTARSDASTNALSSLLAEGDVQIKQPGNLARGERATYTAATDVLELTGKPTLETPQVIITDAQTLVWDKANNRFTATAPYKLKLRPDALKKTGEVPKP